MKTRIGIYAAIKILLFCALFTLTYSTARAAYYVVYSAPSDGCCTVCRPSCYVRHHCCVRHHIKRHHVKRYRPIKRHIVKIRYRCCDCAVVGIGWEFYSRPPNTTIRGYAWEPEPLDP